MTRLTGLITHNWPLKLAAIALATLLYAGLALSQNARIWPGRVPIEAVNQPSGAFLLENLGDVTTIRYYAPADVAARISSSDFQALADLSSVTPVLGGAPVSVPVQVIPLDPRIKVLDFQPDRVAVRLDPVITRTVPITVERGTVPAGLQIGDPVLGAQTAAVRGASSLVERVETASARVAIDPTGINVDGDVDLVALDARGDLVAPVDIVPDRVHVTIIVARELASRSLPVAPDLVGAPAAGWSVRSVTVVPAVVTVRGPLDAVAAMTSIATRPDRPRWSNGRPDDDGGPRHAVRRRGRGRLPGARDRHHRRRSRQPVLRCRAAADRRAARPELRLLRARRPRHPGRDQRRPRSGRRGRPQRDGPRRRPRARAAMSSRSCSWRRMARTWWPSARPK